MRHLRELLGEIEQAVVSAAQQVQESNLNIFQRYFVPVEPLQEEELERLSDLLDRKAWLGKYAPKTVTIEYPVMLPMSAPVPLEKRVHEVIVPLISLVPPQNYYIEEMRVELNVEVEIDSAGEVEFLLVSPGHAGASPTGGGERARARVEVLVKRGEAPATLVEIIKGYDRALRGQVPG
ncbi:MAG: DUF2589 domain-containing protein [Verrucomicrobiota bacterium]